MSAKNSVMKLKSCVMVYGYSIFSTGFSSTLSLSFNPETISILMASLKPVFTECSSDLLPGSGSLTKEESFRNVMTRSGT